jgi:hypothetical protein
MMAEGCSGCLVGQLDFLHEPKPQSPADLTFKKFSQQAGRISPQGHMPDDINCTKSCKG